MIAAQPTLFPAGHVTDPPTASRCPVVLSPNRFFLSDEKRGAQIFPLYWVPPRFLHPAMQPGIQAASHFPTAQQASPLATRHVSPPLSLYPDALLLSRSFTPITLPTSQPNLQRTSPLRHSQRSDTLPSPPHLAPPPLPRPAVIDCLEFGSQSWPSYDGECIQQPGYAFALLYQM